MKEKIWLKFQVTNWVMHLNPIKNPEAYPRTIVRGGTLCSTRGIEDVRGVNATRNIKAVRSIVASNIVVRYIKSTKGVVVVRNVVARCIRFARSIAMTNAKVAKGTRKDYIMRIAAPTRVAIYNENPTQSTKIETFRQCEKKIIDSYDITL